MKEIPKVLTAMSGGVDSGVAAALLRRQGFNVTGVFLRLYDSLNLRQAQKNAKKIAEFLEIPFFVLDLRKEFKKKVIDYFLEEFRKTKTPNPCVVCNKEIKFGLLLKEAEKRGFNFIATGHYIKIKNARLFCAEDKQKDQSYFLWQMNQKQLKHILFPLGNYTKTEVKNLAKKFGISKFIRPESQDICFIQEGLDKFLKKHLRQKSGPIAEQVRYGASKIIGEHEGLYFYTIGQRSGIGVGGGNPYYVLGKNLKKNILIVTRREKDLDKKELIAEKINWISGQIPKLPLKVKAKIRYRHKSALAIITKNLKPKTYHLKFNQPQRAITPGQSVVFYKGKELLGGGIID
jgi:tRNA-specific 2-thiouridylase